MFNAICESEILAKISKFTVYRLVILQVETVPSQDQPMDIPVSGGAADWSSTPMIPGAFLGSDR